MTPRELIGLFAGVATVTMAGCGGHSEGPPLEDYRYRLTVEVQTPQGLRSGSSVIEVSSSVASQNAFPEPGKVSTQVHGDAVAVDLGGGRVLFALLSLPGEAEGASRYAFAAFKPAILSRDYASRVLELKAQTEAAVLPRDRTPMLVTFGDLRNPKSVVAVDPDNLAATFGASVKLVRITVRMTNDPVTRGIEKKLGWLSHLASYRSDPSNPFTSTLPGWIGHLRSE